LKCSVADIAGLPQKQNKILQAKLCRRTILQKFLQKFCKLSGIFKKKENKKNVRVAGVQSCPNY
jgi:hypothetical protein